MLRPYVFSAPDRFLSPRPQKPNPEPFDALRAGEVGTSGRRHLNHDLRFESRPVSGGALSENRPVESANCCRLGGEEGFLIHDTFPGAPWRGGRGAVGAR